MDELYSTPKIDFSKPIDVSGLKGQTAIVTGGASGIGLGIGTALAEAGVHVVLVDKNAEDGEAAAAGLVGKNLQVKFVAIDVTSYDAQLAVFKTAIAFSPKSTIDIVVPAAGISGGSIAALAMPADLAPDADPPPPSTLVMDINLYGVYYSTYLAVHYFKKQQAQGSAPTTHRPQMLFISSLAGYGDQPLNSNYSASKFGVRGIWKSLRSCGSDLGNMRVNLLAPTFILTGMTKNVVEGVAKRGVKVGEVADVVDGAMRCLSDESVEARAVVIAPGKENGGAPGSANFDVCDDLMDYDAAKTFLEHLRKGTFGENFAELAKYTKKSREGTGWTSYRE